MAILRITSEAMVITIKNQVIANRLAVNATKPQVMCLRTKQKRTQMQKSGGEYDLRLTIEGKFCAAELMFGLVDLIFG